MAKTVVANVVRGSFNNVNGLLQELEVCVLALAAGWGVHLMIKAIFIGVVVIAVQEVVAMCHWGKVA